MFQVLALSTNDVEFLNRVSFLSSVGCSRFTRYLDVPYIGVPMVETTALRIILLRLVSFNHTIHPRWDGI